MDDVKRKADEAADKMREDIRREQEEQPNRIVAPPIFPRKKDPEDNK
jgi:hypothetical protein